MKSILLIDADSVIPNIPLMKISRFYKNLNYKVDFIKLNIPYYPSKKHIIHNIETKKYDKVFASVIFNDNYKYIKGDNIIFGGTGYDYRIKLPLEIENIDPDYSLYNSNITYDFITRGCIRNCYFCCVRQKEGYLSKVKDVKTIIKEMKSRNHNEIVFMDNNILAYKDHLSIFNILQKENILVNFNQGLDFRLLNKENQNALNKLKYKGSYIFAFDNWNYKNQIDKKLYLLKRFGDWKVKLYIYVNPNMPLIDTINRINYCKKHKLLPYIMRDISCFTSIYKDFYTDISAYCNQPNFFKKMDFKYFLFKRHKNNKRIQSSYELFYQKSS